MKEEVVLMLSELRSQIDDTIKGIQPRNSGARYGRLHEV